VGTLQSTSSTLENDVTSLQQSLSLLTSRVTDLENSGGGAFTFPVLNVDPIVQVSAGESLSHAVFAYYASFVSIDNRGGASTSLKLSDASGGNDNYGGFLTWNPGNSDVGVYTVTLSASNESQQTATTTNITVAVAPADMVYLAHSEGGSLATFWMGDPFGWEFGAESDESPRHEVELSPFYIDRYEVSKAFWETIRASASTYGYSSLPSTSSNQKPMSNVDWFESIAWCNLRSEVEGLDIVYFTDSSLTTPYRNAGTAPVIYKDFSANGYRLPTEAEWEYAARGGIDGARYSWGNTDPSSVVMNAFGLFNGTLDVDDPWILPNNYGLMHITGNVAEWVWDYYQSSYYTFSPDTNPSGPTTGSVRGHRGGAYNTASAEDLLASNRSSATPTQGSASRGFRTVREP
jgi:sulfatase modifying factor 1